MPGPEDRTSDVWKDQDVNPEKCGFCSSPNIGKEGDFFRCRNCGHDWPARVNPEDRPQTMEEAFKELRDVVAILVECFLVLPEMKIATEKAEKVQGWINRYLK